MTARMDPARLMDASARWMSSSIDAWAANARAMVASVESGTYSPSDPVAGAVNAVGALCRIGYEWLEYVLTGRIPESAHSDEYPVARQSAGTLVLELAGPLQGTMPPIGTIDESRVRIVPPQLSGPDASFHLEVDATGCHGDAYLGDVRVLSGTTVVQTITVVVQVA